VLSGRSRSSGNGKIMFPTRPGTSIVYHPVLPGKRMLLFPYCGVWSYAEWKVGLTFSPILEHKQRPVKCKLQLRVDVGEIVGEDLDSIVSELSEASTSLGSAPTSKPMKPRGAGLGAERGVLCGRPHEATKSPRNRQTALPIFLLQT